LIITDYICHDNDVGLDIKSSMINDNRMTNDEYKKIVSVSNVAVRMESRSCTKPLRCRLLSTWTLCSQLLGKRWKKF